MDIFDDLAKKKNIPPGSNFEQNRELKNEGDINIEEDIKLEFKN